MFRNFRLPRWEAYTMTNKNNEVACRCDACRKASTNEKGLMWVWDACAQEVVPFRDLEVRA